MVVNGMKNEKLCSTGEGTFPAFTFVRGLLRQSSVRLCLPEMDGYGFRDLERPLICVTVSPAHIETTLVSPPRKEGLRSINGIASIVRPASRILRRQ